MYGNNYYPSIHIGLNKNVPFRKYSDNGEQISYHDINVILTNKPKERMQCIVVEKNGEYADFYFNGSEGCFKQLTEFGYEDGSWEEEMCGTTPNVILENGISQDLVDELIEYDY